jgi:hypothetical protein
MVAIPSPLKEVSRDRASEAWMVTINKISNVEIRIFVITRIKKFVDIVTSPLFKKLLKITVRMFHFLKSLMILKRARGVP